LIGIDLDYLYLADPSPASGLTIDQAFYRTAPDRAEIHQQGRMNPALWLECIFGYID
jgi:hypothetical protein